MADTTNSNRPPPLYRAVPVLDAQPAELPPPLPEVVLDAIPLPPHRAEKVLDAVLVEPPTAALIPDAILVREPLTFWGLICLVAGFIHSVCEWMLGALVLTIGLAILAALPIFQFLSLGYLLESGGRVARTGRLRDGFIGVRLAARLGGIVVACWLLLLPLRFASNMANSANIIDPGGRAAHGWRLALLILIGVTAAHILAACARGGKLRYFLWPFNFVWVIRRTLRGGYYGEARDAVWNTARDLRLPYYFWLGLRGFAAAMIWLFIPVSLLVMGHASFPAAALVGWLGALLLAFVLLYLPFLQMRLAQQDRFLAAFEWRAVRADFRRAPYLSAIAFVVTMLSAIPPYLLKIEVVPAEAAWLPSLVFVAFIFPARLLTGWALGKARKRESERHWFFRWTARLPFVPVALFYVLILYFTQFTSWNGRWSLYEQHAFLVPVPFFGM